MKKKINKILDSKTPVIIFGSLVFVYFIYSAVMREYSLSEHKFTIAKATGTQQRGNSLWLEYIFYVNGDQHWGEEYLGDECGQCKVGKYFRLKYSYKEPGYSELYFDEEITDVSKINAAGFNE